MAQKPEDFTLPLHSIKKILEDHMPASVKFTEAAKLALSKAACIFILYLTTAANGFSQDNHRKRVLGKDVIEALMDLDMGFVVPALQSALAEHHKTLMTKKQAKTMKKDQKNVAQSNIAVDVDELDVGEEVVIIGSGSESEAEVVEDEGSEVDVSTESGGSEEEAEEEEEEA